MQTDDIMTVEYLHYYDYDLWVMTLTLKRTYKNINDDRLKTTTEQNYAFLESTAAFKTYSLLEWRLAGSSNSVDTTKRPKPSNVF